MSVGVEEGGVQTATIKSRPVRYRSRRGRHEGFTVRRRSEAGPLATIFFFGECSLVMLDEAMRSGLLHKPGPYDARSFSGEDVRR